MKYVALWNASGLNNIGDRIINRVTRQQLSLRMPSASFETFCPWAGIGVSPLIVNQDGTWNGQGAFQGIVVGGGALVMGPPFAHPALQFFTFGPFPARFSDPATKVWNAMCCDGQFLAPLRDEWSRYLRHSTDLLTLCSVRNEATFTYLRDCGVGRDISVVPDPAVLTGFSNAIPARKPGRPKIGISIARPVFTDAFIAQMADSASALNLHANPDVVRMSAGAAGPSFDPYRFSERWAEIIRPLCSSNTVQIAGIGRMYGDHEIAGVIGEKLSEVAELVELDTDEKVMSWLQEMDVVVAGRLHHCILAFAAGKSVVAVDPYYNQVSSTSKVHQFMNSIGSSKCYARLEEVFSGDVEIAELILLAAASNERFSGALASARDKAIRHFDSMADALNCGSC